ncbi:MAG TPA: cellulose synthase family protein [Acidobacteriota bacterium]|jgi:cellulose synthase/poly-beta-1,6-N-acetylglucosamine synthase-like glycosyltransferase|nr:cellulose synthase family protein [Acidobacteriota bacterium]
MNIFGPGKTPLQKFLETDNLAYLYGSNSFDLTILLGYFLVLSILAIYGIHRYHMVYLYYKYKNNKPQPRGALPEKPRVTVQLPIYNEMYVVERLIESVCALDWPKELLEIQVLDDSTDQTQQIAAAAVLHMKAGGHDIHYIRRPNRIGFKAGALENGLKLAKGNFIAIFDADFMPKPQTLNETIDYFSDPKVGMVQIRWGHINRDYSFLTKVQSILLDGHFVIEHTARNRSGRFFNFNGTAGIWRRAAIETAGGWEHDTLTEDLDLSYRAQMKGWQFIFLPEIVAPAEIPVEMNSFKRQQNRWAKGSIQTGKKILPKLLRSDLPLRVKVEAFFHLTANIAYPLMIVLSLLLFPALIIRFHQGWFEMLVMDLPLFMAATFSVSSFYVVSQREIYPDWKSNLKYLPFLMSVGIGLSVSNTKAVLEALLGIDSIFLRTPKYSVTSARDQWITKKYHARIGMLPLLEVLLGIYFSLMIAYALDSRIYGTIPFLFLFMVGFLYTGLMSLFQSTRVGALAQAVLVRIGE